MIKTSWRPSVLLLSLLISPQLFAASEPAVEAKKEWLCLLNT